MHLIISAHLSDVLFGWSGFPVRADVFPILFLRLRQLRHSPSLNLYSLPPCLCTIFLFLSLTLSRTHTSHPDPICVPLYPVLPPRETTRTRGPDNAHTRTRTTFDFLYAGWNAARESKDNTSKKLIVCDDVELVGEDAEEEKEEKEGRETHSDT